VSSNPNVREINPNTIFPGCVLPQKAAGIEELFDWAQNYESIKNPFSIFLSLTGYYEEEFGETLHFQDGYSSCLGYIELRLLGSALNIFENESFETVYGWCKELLATKQ